MSAADVLDRIMGADPDYTAAPEADRDTFRARFFGAPPPRQLDILRQADPEFAAAPPDQQRGVVIRLMQTRAADMRTRAEQAGETATGYRRALTSGLTGAGMVAGGLLTRSPVGAGLGAAAGRSLENAINTATGDQPPGYAGLPSAAEAAAQGATAEAGGQVLGTGLAAILGRMLPRLSPSGRAALATAQREGVPMTAAEARQSPMLAKAETTTERFPIGAGPMTAYREGQREATAGAAQRLGAEIGPTAGAEEAGALVRDVSGRAVESAATAEATRKAALPVRAAQDAEQAAQSVIRSLGPGASREDVVAAVQKVLRTAEERARAEGGASFEALKAEVGDSLAVAPTKTSAVVREIAKREAGLPGLERPGLRRVASGVGEVVGTEPAMVTVGGQPVRTESLPAALVRELGLDRAEPLGYATARDIESRIGGAMRATRNSYDYRQLKTLRDALRHDLDAAVETVPGNIGERLRDAREFWRTRVVEPYERGGFARDLIRGKPAKESATVESVLLDRHNAERITALKTEMDRVDPGAWTIVQRRFGERTLEAARDADTGLFNPDKFARELARYDEPTLRAILGDKAQDLAGLVGQYQRAATSAQPVRQVLAAQKIFRDFADKAPEVVVGHLARRPASEVQSIKAAVTPEQWGKIGRAWWDDVILPASVSDKTGVFSRARFLTALGKHDDAVIRELVTGPGATVTELYDRLGDFRRLLQRQESVRPLGDNPSGTAQALLGAAQLGASGAKVGQLGAALFVGSTAGMTTGGAIVVAPWMLGKFLASKTGIKLLTEGVTAPAGTQAAQQAALRMGIFLASDQQRDEAKGGP